MWTQKMCKTKTIRLQQNAHNKCTNSMLKSLVNKQQVCNLDAVEDSIKAIEIQ